MKWYELDSSGLEWGPMAGSCERSCKHSDSIKCLEILEQLRVWSRMKNYSAPYIELVSKINNSSVFSLLIQIMRGV
jgi:hypothetical protein